MSWFSETSLDNSVAALTFSVQFSVLFWLLTSMGMCSSKTLHNFFEIAKGFWTKQFLFCSISHNSNLIESPTYIAVLRPAFLFHASPVCPLVLCCNSGCYFPVSVIPVPSPFIFCTWCSSSSVSLSRVITLLYKCTVCSWEQGYIYVTSAI